MLLICWRGMQLFFSSNKINSVLMQVSLVSPENIRRHLANTSPSKYAFAFPKQERFRSLNPECKNAYYANNGNKTSKVMFTIPKSKRSDFTQTLTCSPPPTKYQNRSIFQKNPLKGRTFGFGRDRSPDRSYFRSHHCETPGPGQYNNEKQQKSSSSYSLRSRTADFVGDRLSFKNTPAPGTYEVIDLQPKNGRFRISKFKDLKLGNIVTKEIRFKSIELSPGSPDYVRKDSFSNNGSYMLSHHKGEGRRPFDRAMKINFTEPFKNLGQTLPGPGQYDKPSDFGVYGSRKYFRSFNSTIN